MGSRPGVLGRRISPVGRRALHEQAAEAYEDALKETLPGTALTVVQQQAAKVRQAHDNVRDIRDREKVAR